MKLKVNATEIGCKWNSCSGSSKDKSVNGKYKVVRGLRNWSSTELKEDDANKFRAYLKENNITFETSDAGYGYTHFECLMSIEEFDEANHFLDTF